MANLRINKKAYALNPDNDIVVSGTVLDITTDYVMIDTNPGTYKCRIEYCYTNRAKANAARKANQEARLDVYRKQLSDTKKLLAFMYDQSAITCDPDALCILREQIRNNYGFDPARV